MKKLTLLAVVYFCNAHSAFSQTLNWQWAAAPTTVASNQTLMEGWADAADINSNVYVCGWFSAPFVVFGSDTVFSYNNYENCYVAKYSPAGTPLWVRGAKYPGGIPTTVTAISLATDKHANVYAAGYYYGDSVSFGPFRLPSLTDDSPGLFVVKFDSTGNVLWASSPVGIIPNVSMAIATDVNGNAYLTGGYISHSITFGAFTLSHASQAQLMDAFIVKYDSAGDVLWAKGSQSASQNSILIEANGIATDASGNVYITGGFYCDTIRFGGITIVGGNNSEHSYLAKYDSLGNVIWAKDPVGAYSLMFGVAAYENSSIYITGYYNPDTGSRFYLGRFDTAGNELWHQGSSLCAIATGYSVAVDMNDNAYISGGFVCDSITIGGVTTVFAGEGEESDPMMVYSFDSTGNVICAQSFRSGGDDNNGITVGRNGIAYVTGDFEDGDIAFGNYNLSGNDGDAENTFTAAFICGSCTDNPVNLTAGQTTICPLDTAQICAPSGYSTYLWNTGQTGTCINTQTSGDYYVTVTDNGGCSATSNHITIHVYASPQVTITINGDTLRGYNANSYQWLLNGTAIQGATSSQYIALIAGSYTLQIVDSNGCTATSNAQIINGINGIDDKLIGIYPNPSRGNWVLTVDNSLIGAAAEVFDAAGRLVYKSEITNLQSEIDFNAAVGVYELRITSTNYKVARTLVRM